MPTYTPTVVSTIVSGINFFDYQFSTGMIINISGSKYSGNNKQYNILRLSENEMDLSYQGTYFKEVGAKLELLTQEYLRAPRESYNKDISYRFEWSTEDNNIFLYDFSGDNLVPYKNISDYTYTGIKPLISESNIADKFVLNTNPNSDISEITNPLKQQTVFSGLSFVLDQLDSNNINYLPTPLQLYIGFNNPNEGVSSKQLNLYKVDPTIVSGLSDTGITYYFDFNANGEVVYNTDALFSFINLGLEVGQNITFSFVENSSTGQTIFPNYKNYNIISLSRYKITVDTSNDEDWTILSTSGKTFNWSIKVNPVLIGQFMIYGQTEIEDERFKINLSSVGAKVNEDTIPIFKESDIDEFGIDYILLNRKRKEMLTVYPEIYNYISSYRALINAINFFGYNDLELYEYYRNVDPNSPLYHKLHKVLIPDIFNNSVQGWNSYDYVLDKGKNNYKKTNLFNLTYRITDEDGNNVLMYSLAEVQFKLNKLKEWLRKNVIPISANIYDISGVADCKGILYNSFDPSNKIKKFEQDRTVPVINYNYIATLNFGTEYLVTVNFYTITGSTIPDDLYWQLKIKTFDKDSTGKLLSKQYFKLYKNDLTSFSFTVNSNEDAYIYIETTNYSSDGVGYSNNSLFNFDIRKNYTLINNNFKYKDFTLYETSTGGFYIINDGEIFILN